MRNKKKAIFNTIFLILIFSITLYMGGERLSVGDHDFFAVVIVDGRDLGVSEGVYDRVAVI